MASFVTIADYAGVGDEYLKEANLLMGRSGKHLASVVSGVSSLLLNRKLQGTGYNGYLFNYAQNRNSEPNSRVEFH